VGLLADAAELLADLQADADGETVSYTRPGVVAGRPITAVVSFPTHEVDSSLNAPARIESRKADFIIRVADIEVAFPEPALAGLKPEKGDWIDRTIGTKTVRYVVQSDRSQPAFEYSDADQVAYRVHTRLLAGLPAVPE
jgi:hypothetical protein